MIVEAEMILIKNARVMDPESGFDQVTDILLDGKKIRQIGKAVSYTHLRAHET